MIENEIGMRYADALSESIADEKQLAGALETMRSFSQAFDEDPQLARFFIHPTIPEENKEALVMELCGRFSAVDEIKKLLKMLVERKKIVYVKNITKYFEEVVDDRLNQARVNVAAAHPLSKENLNSLKDSLKKILGKTVMVETTVDEALIGGIKLSVGGLVADATVKNSLALLKQSIEKEEVI